MLFDTLSRMLCRLDSDTFYHPKLLHFSFLKAAREIFPNEASWCSNFMRHKTCLISPQQLDKYGIPYTKVVQEERCAIIVFPYAYHSGFNHGFNIAESTNFALPR